MGVQSVPEFLFLFSLNSTVQLLIRYSQQTFPLLEFFATVEALNSQHLPIVTPQSPQICTKYKEKL